MRAAVPEGLDEAGTFGTVTFDELARSARPVLVRVAQAVTGRREDAEDAVQASLVKAMGAWSRVEGQERWRQQAYVRRIVINTCRSSWRRWGARVSVGDPPELVQLPRTDAVDDRELVRQAMQCLPTRQREVLLLRYYEDLSEAEIAERLGCAPGTVKSSAARGLRSLREMLPEFAPSASSVANAEPAGSRAIERAAGQGDCPAAPVVTSAVAGAGVVVPIASACGAAGGNSEESSVA